MGERNHSRRTNHSHIATNPVFNTANLVVDFAAADENDDEAMMKRLMRVSPPIS